MDTRTSTHRSARFGGVRLLVTVALTVCFTMLLPGQTPEWNLGSYRFATTIKSPPLRIRGAGLAGLTSFRMVSRVGGVNFEETLPADGLAGTLTDIIYDPSQPDGWRLSVSIDNRVHHVALMDWQLRPTVMFADSEYTAAVSLFGEGPEPDDNYYIEYHEAFEDTLLGMRLLQSDIMLMDLDEFWQLPSMNGEIVLGAGESATTAQTSRAAADRIERAMAGANFRSWVLTDVDARVEVAIDQSVLEVKVDPYYSFWTADFDAYDRMRSPLIAQADLLELQLQTKEIQLLGLESSHRTARAANQVDEANRIADQHALLEDEWAALQDRRNALVDRANEMEPRVSTVRRLTDTMKTMTDDLRAFNPPVYDAVAHTAAYAALFRHAKEHQPDEWDAFVRDVGAITVTPTLQTPTVMPR